MAGHDVNISPVKEAYFQCRHMLIIIFMLNVPGIVLSTQKYLSSEQ